MTNGYLTVVGRTENVTVIERSKFICNVKGIENEEEAKAFIEDVRKEQSLASHNCYAYVADDLGLIQKFTDNGEPQGTAGMPMLDVLKNRKIFKVVAVVTRYFGGIKLGTGGLVRAYGGAVSECLDKAKIVSMERVARVRVTADYDSYSSLLKIFSTENCLITDTNFADKIVLSASVKVNCYDAVFKKLSDLYKGNPQIQRFDDDFSAF